MEFLSNGWNVLLILLGFGALIFIHELGHYMAARWAGIRCEGFAVGMGPVLGAWRAGIGWRAGSTDPATIARFGKTAMEMDDDELARNGIGETEWSLRALPLGGYVKMLGQDDLDPTKVSPSRRSYQRAPVWKRMVVVSAGVAFNLVLAVALFVLAFMVGVRFEAPVVGGVIPGSPAAAAVPMDGGTPGLRAGDALVSIDGSPVHTFADIQIAGAMARPGESIDITVVRTEGGSAPREIHFTVTPRKDAVTGLLAIGIEPAGSATVGAAAPAERELFESTMHAAGLDPEGSGATAARLTALVGIGGSSTPGAPLEEYLPATAGEPQVATLATAALADAAMRSGGTPFATQWRTSAGTTVERSLAPIPDLQTLAAPAAGGEPAEIDRGILGLVPLMRIQSVAAGSPNADLLRAGDVILRVENADGPRMAQLRAALAPRAGGTADVVVLRDGKETIVAARVDRAGRMGVLMGPALDLPITASPIERVVDGTGGTQPTAAAELALLPRMRIEEVGGTPVTDWASLRAALRTATTDAAARGEAESVPVVVSAPTPGRERIETALALSPADVRSVHALGWLSPVPPAIFEPLMTRLTAHGNPTTAVAMGFRQTKTMVTMTYITLDRIFRGSVGVEQLRGPVGIVHLGARVVDRGAMYLVFFLAMISVNLAVLNFLPLPIVDGGLFLYLLYEQLAGRAPSLRFQNAATMVGLLLLGTLFLFTFYNDVMRIFTGG